MMRTSEPPHYQPWPRGQRPCRLVLRGPDGQLCWVGTEDLLSQDVPIGATQVSLAQLNERSRDIFRQIVESYLATGEPVGSRNISRLITTPLSPASVRNVMSDLEQLGLVYAPHTSAGRLPTETRPALLRRCADGDRRSRRSRSARHGGARSPPPAKSMDAVLNEASGMLSGLTRAAGVVLTGKVERAPQAHRVRAARARARARRPGRGGRPGREPRSSALPLGLPTSSLTEADQLPQRARARPHAGGGQGRAGDGRSRPARPSSTSSPRRSSRPGFASWSGGESDERKLIVRGAAHLLDDLKALEDLERVRLLFDDLETKRGAGRPARPRRARRGRAHLHRLGEQAVLAVGLLHHRRALSRRRRPHRRRARRDRADPAQLRPRSFRWSTTPPRW